MYLLFVVLHEEAITVKLQVQLLCHKKLQHHQKKKDRDIQGKIFDLWEQFNKHDITTTDLLSWDFKNVCTSHAKEII